MPKLTGFMQELAQDFRQLPNDPRLAQKMVVRFDEVREMVSDLSNTVRVTEMHYYAGGRLGAYERRLRLDD